MAVTSNNFRPRIGEATVTAGNEVQPRKGEVQLNDFLSFRTMVTPIIIKIVFWIGVAVVILSGLITLFTADGIAKLGGLVMIVVGPLLVRIYSELLIVLFKIHECLEDVRKNTGGAAGQQSFSKVE